MCRRVRILNRLAPVLPLGVFVVHVLTHRSWSEQCVGCHDVIEHIGLQRSDQRPHGRALELEYSDRVGSSDQFEGLLVVQWDIVDVHQSTAGSFDQFEATFDDRQRSQTEEVHLQ